MMKKRLIRFEELDEARKILGLEERVTMYEIKTAYRRLEYYPSM